jgi:raffinose/stachyose/melibiose transport system substrate-binding protein
MANIPVKACQDKVLTENDYIHSYTTVTRFNLQTGSIGYYLEPSLETVQGLGGVVPSLKRRKEKGAMLSSSLKRGVFAVAACATLFATVGAVAPAHAATTTITWLTQNGPTALKKADSVVKAFEAANPSIHVEVHGRPGGADGDNLIKTKLATGNMEDVFDYNTGALLIALNPAKTLVPVTKEKFQKNVYSSFQTAVTVSKQVYGAPYDVASGGGIYYNTDVFKAAGIKSNPKTWAEFVTDAKKIKASGVDAVCGTNGDSWTAQLLVLADFYNVHAAMPDFVAKYNANKAKYAKVPAALAGFQHIEELAKAGLYNADAATAKYNDAITRISNGKCGMYPMGTWFTSSLTGDALNKVGFFALPGKDPKNVGLTTWMPSGLYIAKTTTHLAETKKFLAFVASKAGTDAFVAGVGYQGPFVTKDQSKAPADAALATRNLAALVSSGKTFPALEFLSAIKGPNLPGICVQVATGQVTAAAGAALYDQDVVAQAQQLGLAGW